MDWLRLLAAGKSLVGLRDGQSRYRVAPTSKLPNFGSTRNPFRVTTLPSGGVARITVEESHADAAQAQGANLGKAGKLQQIAARFFASRATRPIDPVVRPVQSELALERVRVVRNDWTDLDATVMTATPVQSTNEAGAPLTTVAEPAPKAGVNS